MMKVVTSPFLFCKTRTRLCALVFIVTTTIAGCDRDQPTRLVRSGRYEIHVPSNWNEVDSERLTAFGGLLILDTRLAFREEPTDESDVYTESFAFCEVRGSAISDFNQQEFEDFVREASVTNRATLASVNPDAEVGEIVWERAFGCPTARIDVWYPEDRGIQCMRTYISLLDARVFFTMVHAQPAEKLRHQRACARVLAQLLDS